MLGVDVAQPVEEVFRVGHTAKLCSEGLHF